MTWSIECTLLLHVYERAAREQEEHGVIRCRHPQPLLEHARKSFSLNDEGSP